MDYDECKALFSLANCEKKDDRERFKQLNEQGSNSLNGTHWKCHGKTTNKKKHRVEQRISLMRITICYRKKIFWHFPGAFVQCFVLHKCIVVFFSLTTRFFFLSTFGSLNLREGKMSPARAISTKEKSI